MQPIGEASEEVPVEYKEGEDEELVGEIAYKYLSKPYRDTTFGIHKEGFCYFIGDQEVSIEDNDIILMKSDERFEGTPSLWELITYKTPRNFNKKDYNEYKNIMLLTNALFRNYDPYSLHPRGSRSEKWVQLLSPIWHEQRKRMA